MAKHIVQDVIPPEKRSIRNIPIPERKVRVVRGKKRADEDAVYDEPAPKSKAPVRAEEYEFSAPRSEGKRRAPKKILWTAVAVVMLILAFAVSTLFGGAEVLVTPRQAVVAAAGTMTAVSNPSDSGAEGAVPFEAVTVTRDGSKEVAASEETHVERRAAGTIVIYNNHSTASQRLVKNTRFETAAGLIYRINESVDVPGIQTVGGEKVPGSVEAEVTADQPGEQYNIEPTDFTIPGFEGDPRFETFYGRSKTAISGGFVGSMKVVADDTLAEAEDEIRTKLKEELLRDLEAQIPEGYSVLEETMSYNFESLPQSGGDDDSVTVNVRGTLAAAIFEKTALGAAVADRFLPDYNGGAVEIANLDELSLAVVSEEGAAIDVASSDSFEFTLDGNAELIWKYDEAAMKEDLAGAKKSEVNMILGKYPAIESAEVVVRPFWNRSLPADPQKIKVRNTAVSSE